MDKTKREQLKEKLDEISTGFSSLVDKIDDMPDADFANVCDKVDEFRFKYAKVLNLSPDGDSSAGRTPGFRGAYNLGEDAGVVPPKTPTF